MSSGIEYYAVFCALFESPVLLADKPGQPDLEILTKLVGRLPTNSYEEVRVLHIVRISLGV